MGIGVLLGHWSANTRILLGNLATNSILLIFWAVRPSQTVIHSDGGMHIKRELGRVHQCNSIAVVNTAKVLLCHAAQLVETHDYQNLSKSVLAESVKWLQVDETRNLLVLKRRAIGSPLVITKTAGL